METPISLGEAFLQVQAQEHRGVGFLSESTEVRFVPYGRLYRRARGIQALLQSHGLRAGDRVVLVLNDNELLVTVFWACILGGIVCAPLAFTSSREQWSRLSHVIRIMEARAIIADTGSAPVLGERLRDPTGDSSPGPAAVITVSAEMLDDWEEAGEPAQCEPVARCADESARQHLGHHPQHRPDPGRCRLELDAAHA
jgi:acyl-CoA synthetase (AMP-forming)/AMP-acid ligase II